MRKTQDQEAAPWLTSPQRLTSINFIATSFLTRGKPMSTRILLFLWIKRFVLMFKLLGIEGCQYVMPVSPYSYSEYFSLSFRQEWPAPHLCAHGRFHNPAHTTQVRNQRAGRADHEVAKGRNTSKQQPIPAASEYQGQEICSSPKMRLLRLIQSELLSGRYRIVHAVHS